MFEIEKVKRTVIIVTEGNNALTEIYFKIIINVRIFKTTLELVRGRCTHWFDRAGAFAFG